jgi:hypothetical protein
MKDYCEPVKLLLNTEGPGSAQALPNSPYRLGQQINLTATPDTSNVIFYEWYGDLSSFNNPATLTMDGDKMVTAKFTAPVWYTLAVETIGQGKVTVSPDQSKYLHRDILTLSAKPDRGWGLTGWSGDLAGNNNPAQLMMTGDFKVIATFGKVNSKIYLPLILK